MKIGITCYPTYGGSGVVATELGMELAERGHEVHFITYKQPFRLNVQSPNIFFHEVDVSNYPLEPQRQEAMAKRRIGLGVTGLADALTLCGIKYSSREATASASRKVSNCTTVSRCRNCWGIVSSRAAAASSALLRSKRAPSSRKIFTARERCSAARSG